MKQNEELKSRSNIVNWSFKRGKECNSVKIVFSRNGSGKTILTCRKNVSLDPQLIHKWTQNRS